MLNIDLHTHTDRYSSCSILSPERLLELARKQGLDGVALTEHERFWPAEDIRWLRRAYPELKIFNGVETAVGADHVVVFPPEPDPAILDIDHRRELWSTVDELGGYAFVAHPYRYNSNFGAENPDYNLPGLEVASFNMCDQPAVDKSLEFAREVEVRPLAASDAHSPEPVGSYYLELEGQPQVTADLAEVLRTGDFRPVASCLD